MRNSSVLLLFSSLLPLSFFAGVQVGSSGRPTSPAPPAQRPVPSPARTEPSSAAELPAASRERVRSVARHEAPDAPEPQLPSEGHAPETPPAPSAPVVPPASPGDPPWASFYAGMDLEQIREQRQILWESYRDSFERVSQQIQTHMLTKQQVAELPESRAAEANLEQHRWLREREDELLRAHQLAATASH